MPNEYCLIVRAAGKRLDLARGEASRIAKGSKLTWWTERAEVGVRFCFEDKDAKNAFAAYCDDLGISSKDI